MASSDRQRLFVAIFLPDGVQRCLANVQQSIPTVGPLVRWVAPPLFHCTLRWLGECDEARARHAHAAAAEAALAARPFTLAIGGLGQFSRDGLPHVLWAGVQDGQENVHALHDALDRALAARGVQMDNDAFHPHITLAYVREQAQPLQQESIIRAIEATPAWPASTFAVQQIALMQSISEQGAHIYHTQHVWPLGEAAPQMPE